MRQRGVTLIEVLFGIVMLSIVVVVGVQFLLGSKSDYSYGINGAIETRCVEGFKFVIGQRGQPTQLLDHRGNGVSCEALK
jgi:prepilin-type N-terminal cleavage/methylation domain-containing protein